MTVTAKCLLEAKYAEATETAQYTAATGTRAAIDKFTAYSATGGALTVRLVPPAGAAGATNISAVKTLAAGETYTFPELVGHTLNPGGFISTLAAVVSTVVIRISGREVT